MNVVKSDTCKTIHLQKDAREKLNILKDKLNIADNTRVVTFAINYLLKVIEKQDEKNKNN